jgi:chemotaxis protein methyltransferase CheR
MVEQVAERASQSLPLRRDERSDIELQLLLDALLRYAGCDLRALNQSALRRRIADALRAEDVATISALQDRVLHDDERLVKFVISMGGPPHLFNDPSFFASLRANVVPLLRTYSFVRIWVPGIGLGADAFSLAAMLDDAGLLDRTIVYATLFTDIAVAISKTFAYPHDGRKRLEARGRLAGFEQPLERYFDIDDATATPVARLRESVMLTRHNPTTDGSINEFHAIVSRGALSILNGAAQHRLHSLFFESLTRLGFLAIGANESVAGTAHERAFRRVTEAHSIFRRLR